MSLLDPESFGTLLFQTSRIWRQRLDQRLRPLGLSQAKWRTILHLSDGHLTQCELAERLGIEEPTLARCLAGMESEGWVKRQNAAHDRRCKTVHLQRKSNVLWNRIEETARTLRHELVETIPTDDLQTCLRVLNEIRTNALEGQASASLGANGTSAEKKRKPAK